MQALGRVNATHFVNATDERDPFIDLDGGGTRTGVAARDQAIP
jgi:hypothetical protein